MERMHWDLATIDTFVRHLLVKQQHQQQQQQQPQQLQQAVTLRMIGCSAMYATSGVESPRSTNPPKYESWCCYQLPQEGWRSCRIRGDTLYGGDYLTDCPGWIDANAHGNGNGNSTKGGEKVEEGQSGGGTMSALDDTTTSKSNNSSTTLLPVHSRHIP